MTGSAGSSFLFSRLLTLLEPLGMLPDRLAQTDRDDRARDDQQDSDQIQCDTDLRQLSGLLVFFGFGKGDDGQDQRERNGRHQNERVDLEALKYPDSRSREECADRELLHLRRTLKVSHDHGWRGACAARSVTDMIVVL